MTMPRIGFIGQGWIGRHYADDFEHRGFSVVRYGLEPEYAAAKEVISTCDIVFVAVPTPTRDGTCDTSIIEEVLPLIRDGRIAVIKSTVLPGTTNSLQKRFPKLLLLNSPEFLREANAAHDAAHPERTLIGIPEDTMRYHEAAKAVLLVLPPAPYVRVVSAQAAELVKYAGNVFLSIKVVYANLLYELANSLDVPYESVREALAADPRIGSSHLSVHAVSGHGGKGGRGAGGHCFIKDLEAFRTFFEATVPDDIGSALLTEIVRKNNQLLVDSEKDLELLHEVYGTNHPLIP